MALLSTYLTQSRTAGSKPTLLPGEIRGDADEIQISQKPLHQTTEYHELQGSQN